jgi:hypothetical protein
LRKDDRLWIHFLKFWFFEKWVELKNSGCFLGCPFVQLQGASSYLGAFTANTAGELDILGHDGNTLGVNRTQVGILKETNQVSLGGFLEGKDGRSLKTEIGLKVLRNLTHETLKGQLADEQVRRLLVTTDLTKGNGTGTVTVGLLDTSGSGGGLAGSLGGKLLARSLSSGGLASGLFGTGHVDLFETVISRDDSWLL